MVKIYGFKLRLENTFFFPEKQQEKPNAVPPMWLHTPTRDGKEKRAQIQLRKIPYDLASVVFVCVAHHPHSHRHKKVAEEMRKNAR